MKSIQQSIVTCYNNLHSLVIMTNYKRLVLIHKYICFEILSISTDGFLQLSLNVTLCKTTELREITEQALSMSELYNGVLY